MLYLNEEDIYEIGVNWDTTIEVIEKAVFCLRDNDFAQPLKPYLRYRDLKNRIIAMPAYVGGGVNSAGLKWIASFPDNLSKNLPRAHSVVILNEPDTGQPVGIINTGLLSIVRTASVSGLMLRYFDKTRPLEDFNLGIVGFGPIGQFHLQMCWDLFGDKIGKVFLYDLQPIPPGKLDFLPRTKVSVVDSWEKAYQNADVFITCTVSKYRYVDQKPKKGALLLNVSLRDYKVDIYEFVKDTIVVDDWDEVCRENTDVEMMFKEAGLKKEHTRSLIDVVCGHCLEKMPSGAPIMFNPMGMGVFDIATGKYYLDQAITKKVGQSLK
ncbi:MAG TPA: 2,3-diaminopropionate biosynthesis protein SbnB [Bacillota bacterium]|nr:2,3-diaminopropionate biosynthesis protein SbnB [Bacillota bacterium]